ncbi:ethanolamine ammonia-lyase subunit EutC [Hymenobacter lutimineralis]|uniref:Ethanolamine ammonia-lyase small subunit n=1 Tax=Hymenobacter lutimineralis TaxID=2606448 RepID=A0A5D6US59_9BACT|nr:MULTISPECIES: ethanolamine ammonia-lyase subunit EutC [Hymenobacter]QIX59879.1 ethanolamine ammonia-lyase subunit EutC [Hymenobacter sp. BT18]TYZ05885.1 ethanolamine ammonia-lyase subunit EutC [Hymenobacter lutimineralis]
MQTPVHPHTPPPDDPWAGLRAYTAARIALGRTGTSVPLRESLAFRLAHAHARDAVYSTLDLPHLTAGLKTLALPVCTVRSRAETREQYLHRPDYGRQLAEECRQQMQEAAAPEAAVVIILADGLSATAVNEHALPLLHELLPKLRQAGFRLAPVVLAEQARVALSDDIGEVLGARLALMLIGERPGLSAPHSLGAYLTYAPRPGRTDEARNCVSNIRPEGLSYVAAADKLFYLIQESLRRQLSGVALKDETGLLEG